MDVAVLFSGGKDSTMAIYKALNEGHNVKYLVSMISKNTESYMFHVPNINLTKLLAEAMNIPVISVNTDGVKEKELIDLKNIIGDLKNKGIQAIYSGAIYSVYQKSRIDKICNDLNLISISPLWHMDQYEYMLELLDSDFKFILTSVAAEGLDESWLGEIITYESLNKLKQLNEKYGINIAFEGGEAESLVLDCPIFKKRVEIVSSKKEWYFDNGIYIIEDAILKDK